jgi:TPR repeat protein
MNLLETGIMVFSFRKWFARPATCNGNLLTAQTNGAGVEAQFLMGSKFEGGTGVVQDYVQAAHWYAKAAEQNHSLAQLNLAILYAQGQGVGKDDAKSLMWLTRAANLGNATAQYRLGIHEHLACRKGLVPATAECRIEALKWVRLSAAQGYRPAEGACEFVALSMTREEVAQTAVRVGAFVAG